MGRSGVAKVGTFCFKEEFGDLNFGDQRLNQRFMKVIESINKQPHGMIKRTQKSWADMVGAYRMLSNERVEREEILRVHREQTIARMIKTGKLRATKVNRRIFIKVSDIEKMLAANPAVQ